MRLVALVAATATTVLAAPALGAQDAPYTQRDLQVQALVGPAGDQPCTIDARIFRPRGATISDPAPAILATNGFGGSKAEFDALGGCPDRRGTSRRRSCE